MHILGHCMREKSNDGSYLKYHTKSLIDESRSNDNIIMFYKDKGRTARDSKDYFRKRVAEIGIKRKDQVVLCDTVITLPQEYLEESREFKKSFFKSSAEFVGNRYGVENIIGMHIHQDETTPHMHVTWTPVRDGKFQCKNILNRQDMRTFHDDLAEHLYNELQIPREYIMNGKTKEAKNGDELRSGVVELKEEIESLRAQKEGLAEEISYMEGQRVLIRDEIMNYSEDRAYNYKRRIERSLRELEQKHPDIHKEFMDTYSKPLVVLHIGKNRDRGTRGTIRIKKNNSMSR